MKFEIGDEVIAGCKFGNQREAQENECVIASECKDGFYLVKLPYGTEKVEVYQTNLYRLDRCIDDDDALYQWGLENIENLYKMILDSTQYLVAGKVKVELVAPKEGCLGDLYIDIDGIHQIHPDYFKARSIGVIKIVPAWRLDEMVSVPATRFEPEDVDYNVVSYSRTDIEMANLATTEAFKAISCLYWQNKSEEQYAESVLSEN